MSESNQRQGGLVDDHDGADFVPALGMRNGHVMTIVGSLRPRSFKGLMREVPPERREFETEPGTRVVGFAHRRGAWSDAPAMVIVHGLEGSADANYVLGTAEKASRAGFNVLRCNVRGCGGTAALSPRMYHSGLTIDLRHVVRELIDRDRVSELFIVGFSMGGNQSLKLIGEFGGEVPREVRGVCAISPPIDLESCSRSIMQSENRLYEARFLRSLRRTMRERDRLFPGRYDLSGLDEIRHLWDWDDWFQPVNGFRNALDYYQRASSLPLLASIRVPALIVHAQDDPFIPFEPFGDERLQGNRVIRLLAPRHGGHVAFWGSRRPDEDRAWAENRAVEFCRELSCLAKIDRH
jgi:uncharacterized protein